MKPVYLVMDAAEQCSPLALEPSTSKVQTPRQFRLHREYKEPGSLDNYLKMKALNQRVSPYLLVPSQAVGPEVRVAFRIADDLDGEQRPPDQIQGRNDEA